MSLEDCIMGVNAVCERLKKRKKKKKNSKETGQEKKLGDNSGLRLFV